MAAGDEYFSAWKLSGHLLFARKVHGPGLAELARLGVVQFRAGQHVGTIGATDYQDAAIL